MRLRPMRRADLAAVATVGADAFENDVFTDFIARHRGKYPLAYRQSWITRAQINFLRESTYGYVCIDSDSEEDDAGDIVGFAFWTRRIGSSSTHDAADGSITDTSGDPWIDRNSSLWSAFNRLLLNTERQYRYHARVDKSVDRAAIAHLEANFSFSDMTDMLEPLYSGVPNWFLLQLAVSPQHQRRGVGSLLLQHGLDLAREESKERGRHVPVILAAAHAGIPLYRRHGFRVVDWKPFPGPDTAGNAFDAMPAMVWDPSETWIQGAPEGSLKQKLPVDVVWTSRALQCLKDKNTQDKTIGDERDITTLSAPA